MVRLWHKCSVCTLGSVGYKFWLSLFGRSDQCLQRVVLGTRLGWVLGGKVFAQVISVYTGSCWEHIWVESWVVKFWHERSVFTLGCVRYKFSTWLFCTYSVEWLRYPTRLSVYSIVWVESWLVFGVYTGWCWVPIWDASWVVKWSVFKLDCVGYTFVLSLGL